MSRQGDMYSLLKHVRGHPQKRQKTTDQKPIAYVRFNTRLGKAKPVTIKALLDSGGSESLITAKYVQKLRIKSTKGENQVWSTPGGTLTTKSKVTGQFTLPELQDRKIISWDLHVTESLGAYDMIIGRDMLNFLGIDIRFSDMTVQWEGAVMPFKNPDASEIEAFHIKEDPVTTQTSNRLKRILDAKYDAADLDEVCNEQEHLSQEEQRKLHTLLNKYAPLFDGTLGKWRWAILATAL